MLSTITMRSVLSVTPFNLAYSHIIHPKTKKRVEGYRQTCAAGALLLSASKRLIKF
jgi:hypothetical protein